MPQTRIESDVLVVGTISATVDNLPSAGSITNTHVSAAAAIAATKVQQQRNVTVELFGPAVAVAALTKWVAVIRGTTGTLVAIKAATAVIASGADRTIAVDLQKSTGAGAFATVLSGTANFTNASPVRTLVSGTFSSTTLVAGDILEVIVTVAGGAGNQATGLTVQLIYTEDPA